MARRVQFPLLGRLQKTQKDGFHESAIRRLADIVQLQIDYLLIAGFHEKELPDFLGKGCLVKKDGHIEYDFGPDAHFSTIETLPVVSEMVESKKRGYSSGWCQKETILNINTREEIIVRDRLKWREETAVK